MSIRVDRPMRSPDLTLPRERSVSTVEVWVKENIFSIGTTNNTYNQISNYSKCFNGQIKMLINTQKEYRLQLII